ncbi:MAG: integrin alpha, partial [Planctomycetota bacterium]
MRNLSIYAALAFLSFSTVAHAQTTLKTVLGNSADDEFGYAIGNLGDINGDGRDDVIVGARWDDLHGTNSGTVTVYSGLGFVQLYQFKGDTQYDHLGTSVAGVGDIDGDGVPDFAAGADGDDNGGSSSGSVRVWSGRTGAVLYNFNGAASDDVFGTSVAAAGDVNADGFADVIVGAPGVAVAGFAAGGVRVFSGRTGAVLYTLNGLAVSDYFGTSVAGLGDVNGDGKDDFAVGAPYADPNGAASGKVRVFSGATGSQLYAVNGSAAAENFGITISGAGDVDRDGTPDLIVGAPYASGPALQSGVAKVFSGDNGALLYTFTGDNATDLFGSSVAGAGDMDNDNYADVIVGSIWDDVNATSSGSAKVFSGKTGVLMFVFSGDVLQQQFGSQVCTAGDVNNDGFADIIASAYLDDGAGHDAGMIRVISPLPFPTGIYCQGKVNSAGCLPLIATAGTPRVGGSLPFTISASKIVGNKSGFLIYSGNAASTPFQGGT